MFPYFCTGIGGTKRRGGRSRWSSNADHSIQQQEQSGPYSSRSRSSSNSGNQRSSSHWTKQGKAGGWEVGRAAVAVAEGPGKLEGPTKNEQHFPRFIVASFTHTRTHTHSHPHSRTYFILIYRKRARIRAIMSEELTTYEYSMNYELLGWMRFWTILDF